MENDQKLFNYFIANQTYFKNVLLKPLKDDAGRDILENDLLNLEWVDRAKWILVCYICINLNMSSDQVLEFISHINIKELLK